MSDRMEQEKQKLKDLLDMGFIHEEEYRQRFADLTGSTPQLAGEPSLAVEPASTYDQSYSPYEVFITNDTYSTTPSSTFDSPRQSSSYSSTYSSSSRDEDPFSTSSPAVGSSSRSQGTRPFQPVEPCDCGTTYCRCGLQVPQCLLEDHAQVCAKPEWDTFKCALQCGCAFGSSVEATVHLKHCSRYILHCKNAVDHSSNVVTGDFRPCGAEVLACDMAQHWGQVHRPNPTLGELQLPELFDCPAGCGQHLGERWRMPHHFDSECEAYTIECPIMLGSEGYLQRCLAELKRKDVARHWDEVHRPDPHCGPEIIPMKGMDCPNSRLCPAMDRDQLSNHLAHCSEYQIVCHGCREELPSMDGLKAHVAAGCRATTNAPWKCDELMGQLTADRRFHRLVKTHMV